MGNAEIYRDVTAEYRADYSIACGPLVWEPKVVDATEQVLPILTSMPEDWKIIRFVEKPDPLDEEFPPLRIRVLDDKGRDRGRIYTICPKMDLIKGTFGPQVMSLIFIPWSRINICSGGYLVSMTEETSNAYIKFDSRIVKHHQVHIVNSECSESSMQMAQAHLAGLLDVAYPEWRDPNSYWDEVLSEEKLNTGEKTRIPVSAPLQLIKSPNQVLLPWMVYDKYYPHKDDLHRADYDGWATSQDSLLVKYKKLKFTPLGPDPSSPEHYQVMLPEGWSARTRSYDNGLQILDPRGRVRMLTWHGSGELKYLGYFTDFLTRQQSRQDRQIVETVSANGVVLAQVRVSTLKSGYIPERDCSFAIKRSVDEWYNRSFPNAPGTYNPEHVWDLSQEEVIARSGATFGEHGEVIPVDLSIDFRLQKDQGPH